MAPLARRTWAPRGQTPEQEQKGGTREKVSIAAAVWLSPRRDRLGLYSHTLPGGYFDSWHLAAFLEAMMRDLAGRFVVVWDGGPMHRATSATGWSWSGCPRTPRCSTRSSRCGAG
jgi:hypothetical protein